MICENQVLFCLCGGLLTAPLQNLSRNLSAWTYIANENGQFHKNQSWEVSEEKNVPKNADHRIFLNISWISNFLSLTFL